MDVTTPTRPRKERKENADRRRRQLLDASRRSIHAHGLARTTLATVAAEAGLSQGVAVFYFKSKAGLLTETLRDLYAGYLALWRAALADAGPDPRAQLSALIAADFSLEACGPEVLPIWFAFWGELRFGGDYAHVASAFDHPRREALLGIWQEITRDTDRSEQLADWMEALSDGYWQRLHLAPDTFTRATADFATRVCLDRLMPGLGLADAYRDALE